MKKPSSHKPDELICPEWLYGRDTGQRRKFIVHTKAPRFIAEALKQAEALERGFSLRAGDYLLLFHFDEGGALTADPSLAEEWTKRAAIRLHVDDHRRRPGNGANGNQSRSIN